MVGWGRSRSATLSPGPSASTQLFSKHYGVRGPEDRSGWQGESAPSMLNSVMGESSFSPSQVSQPTLTTMVSNNHSSSPPSRRARGVFMEGPVFSNKFQSTQTKAPKYALSKIETLHPPKENGSNKENGHSRDSSLTARDIAPLIIRNGYAKPMKPGISSPKFGKKKRKAPPPPRPPPPETVAIPEPELPPPEPEPDYEEDNAPPVPPKPPSILSTSSAASSSSGSMRKKVSIKEELEFIERPNHEKVFAEFKDELLKTAEIRSKKGNVEPPPRPVTPIVEATLNEDLKRDIVKAAEERAKKGHIEPIPRPAFPVENTLNEELKSEIVKAAQERAKRPFIEPVLKSSSPGQVKEPESLNEKDKPTLPDQLQSELMLEFQKYINRRKSGSLRMRKNNKNTVLYTALPATSIATAVKKDQTKEWVPEQDLVDDVLDGPVVVKEHTSRNTGIPTYFPVFQDATSDIESVQGQYKKGPGSKSSRASSRQNSGKKGKKIKNSFKNALGSLRRSFGRKNKLKDIMNDPQWEIYHAENYDPAPEGPISIHHIESKPAYAYNPNKGQLMLIPDFDKVLITTDGKQIREDTLTKVAKLGADSEEEIKATHVEGTTKHENEVERQRREQMRAEMQFQIVRRQVSGNSDDVFENGPLKAPSNRNYSSLDRLLHRRDNAIRANPIYDSDEEDDYTSMSTESPEEPIRRKKGKSNKQQNVQYTTVPVQQQPMYPPTGLPQVYPLAPTVAMYPGMPVQPNMVPYMVPQWGLPQQHQPPPMMVNNQSLASSMNSSLNTQSNSFTPFIPQAQQSQRISQSPSEVSVGSRSTMINISYDPPVPEPLSLNTSLPNGASSQTSPPATFRPVKFVPSAKPSSFDPTFNSSTSIPAAPSPPIVSPKPVVSPPASVPAPPPVPSSPPPAAPPPPPPVLTSAPPPVPFSPSPPPLPTSPPPSLPPVPKIPEVTTAPAIAPTSGRRSPFPFTNTTHNVTKPGPTKEQVVADKEMPTFYRTDFYRKLLHGPVGWKPVNFQSTTDHAASKDRYLVDTHFDTNKDIRIEPTQLPATRLNMNTQLNNKKLNTESKDSDDVTAHTEQNEDTGENEQSESDITSDANQNEEPKSITNQTYQESGAKSDENNNDTVMTDGNAQIEET